MMEKTQQETELETRLAEAREKVRIVFARLSELRDRHAALASSLDPDDVLQREELDRQIEALCASLHAAKAVRREATMRLARYRSWASGPMGRRSLQQRAAVQQGQG